MTQPATAQPENISVILARPDHRRVTLAAVVAAHNRNLTHDQMIEELECSRGTIISRLDEAARQGLIVRRSAERAKRRLSRITRIKPAAERPLKIPAVDNPALTEGRTLYPKSVRDVGDATHALIDGVNSWKIGSVITKGHWKGFPIRTLTLEERKTCPPTCALWRSCFGNNMSLARRLKHGPELELRLVAELTILQQQHPKGFAIRLHVLGDFYSAEYVRKWIYWLHVFPALHVFGFTARIDGRNDPIARELVEATLAHWPRFAIRFSNALIDECSTATIEHPLQKPDDAIICPQQLGKTETCGTCALCWTTRKRIAFIRH